MCNDKHINLPPMKLHVLKKHYVETDFFPERLPASFVQNWNRKHTSPASHEQVSFSIRPQTASMPVRAVHIMTAGRNDPVAVER